MESLLSSLRFALPLLASCLSALPAVADLPDVVDDDWIVVETGRVQTFSRLDIDETLPLVEAFERLPDALGDFLGLDLEPPAPIRVYIFARGREYRPYAAGEDGFSNTAPVGNLLSGPTGDTIAFVGDQRESFESIVFRGLALRLLRAHRPEWPAWLIRGLGEYVDRFRVENGEAKLGWSVRAHLFTLDDADFTPLPELFALSPQQLQQRYFAAQCWALVHYFLHGEDGTLRPKLFRYLELRAEGRDVAAAIREAFGTEPDRLRRAARLYLELPRLPRTEVAVAPLEATVRELSPLEVRVALARLLVAQGRSRAGGARAHLRAALEIDGEHAPALSLLALLRLEAGEVAESLRLAERARALAGDDPEILRVQGYALYDLGRHDEASAALRRSLELDPRHAEARRVLAQSETALLRARFDRVSSLRAQDRSAEALALLEEIAENLDALPVALRQRLEAELEQVRAIHAEETVDARFDAAVASYRGGRLDEAEAAFESLRLEVEDPETRERIDRMLRLVRYERSKSDGS